MLSAMIPVALYSASSLLNLSGVFLLKVAVRDGNPILAVLGALCWGGSAITFLLLLERSGSNLAVVALTTSVLGAAVVLAVSSIAFAEIPTRLQWVGIAFMIAGLVCTSWPGSG